MILTVMIDSVSIAETVKPKDEELRIRRETMLIVLLVMDFSVAKKKAIYERALQHVRCRSAGAIE